ncbi:MAG: response regulator [Phycisphaerae bacterium]|nr:response regulator [Phycisphaerae bacterium]
MTVESPTTVLLIDDEEIVRRTIAAYLDAAGLTVLEADNGRAGLDLFRQTHPDLVLLDLRMPEMHGLEVLDVLTKESPETPCIVISGAGVAKDVVEAINRGAWDFVLKPIVDMVVFRHTIDKVLERARLLRERQRQQRLLEHKVTERTVQLQAANEALAREVSVRRQAEEALRTSKARWRSLVEHAPGFIATVDRAGTIQYVNRVLPGVNQEAVIGQAIYRFVDPAHHGHVRTAIEQAFDSGLTSKVEAPIANVPGEPIWFETLVGPVRIQDETTAAMLISTDITERRIVEQNLRALSARNQALLHAIPDIVMEVDARKVYTWANPAGLAFFGDAVIGKEATDYFEGEQPTYELVQPLFNGAEDVIYVESWQRRQDGEKRLLAWWCRVLKDADGSVTGAISTARDITEARQTQEELAHYRADLENLVEERTKELRAAQEDLLRKERLATLGQLIGTVAHEIRNPLGTVRTSVFSIDERARGKGLDIERALDRAERNIVRCDAIIEELLDYARLKQATRVPTPLDSWLESVLHEYPVPDGIQLTLALTANATVPLDRERFRRAVLNVLTNAHQAIQQASQPQGRITVETETVANRVRVAIADNGLGIPPDVRDKIFEPLYSTKTFGVGLGLSIVKRTIEQHEGTIELDSTPGRGTTVTFWLPLPQDEVV